MIRASRLFRDYKTDPRATLSDLREALCLHREGKPGGIAPSEFSIADLAEWFIMDNSGEPIGREGLRSWLSAEFLEAAPVSTGAFAAITRMVVETQVLEGYALPDAVLSKTIQTRPGKHRDARLVNFTLPLSETSEIGDVPEGAEKPAVGMYTEYAKNLPPKKKGAVLAITRETVLADDTGQILDAARRIGETIAIQKESLITDFVCGLVQNCVIEKRRGDSSEVTSDLFLASGRWSNSQTNPLGSWEDVDEAEQLIMLNTLPGTDLPPVLAKRFLLVPPQLRAKAFHILNATEVRSVGTSVQVASPSPLMQLGITPLVSPLVYSRQIAKGVSDDNAKGTWFYGDLNAFRYYELWPLEVKEVRDDRTAAVRDVIVEFAVSEYGVPVVVEPRIWCRNLPA